MRRKGAIIPDWQFAGGMNRYGAQVTMAERNVKGLNRHLIVAQADTRDGLLELYDARVVQLTRERAVLVGFERRDDFGDGGFTDYQQSWLVMFDGGRLAAARDAESKFTPPATPPTEPS